MARDLIDDESDLSDSNMEILDYPGLIRIYNQYFLMSPAIFRSEDANNAENGGLPSIEELTRHMQDLTDADKGDADLIELAETAAKEPVGSDEVAVEEGSEVCGAEGTEHAPVAVPGNDEGAPIDTIQVRTILRPPCLQDDHSGRYKSPIDLDWNAPPSCLDSRYLK